MFTREPQTITVLGPKTSAHPKSVPSCVWRKRPNVEGWTPGRPASLCVGIAQLRQRSITLGADGAGDVWGQRAVSECGTCRGGFWGKARPEGVQAPSSLDLLEELRVEGQINTQEARPRAPPAKKVLLSSCCEVQRASWLSPSRPGRDRDKTAVLGRPGVFEGTREPCGGEPSLPPEVPIHAEATAGSWRPREGCQKAASPASAWVMEHGWGFPPCQPCHRLRCRSLTSRLQSGPCFDPVREQCGGTPRPPHKTCLQASRISFQGVSTR